MPELTPGSATLIQAGLWLTFLGATLWEWRHIRRHYVPIAVYRKLVKRFRAAETLLEQVKADFFTAPEPDSHPATAPVEAVVAGAVDRAIAEHPTTEIGPPTMTQRAWQEVEIERIRARSAERNARRPVVVEQPWLDADRESS